MNGRDELFDGLTRSMTKMLRVSSSRSGFARQAAIAGVSLSQPSYALLRVLIDDGPAAMSALARATHMDVGMVTRQVAQLVDAGYAERVQDPNDQRVTVVHATASGRSAAAALQRLRRRHLEVSLGAWSDRDLSTLERLLTRFVADTTGTSFDDLVD